MKGQLFRSSRRSRSAQQPESKTLLSPRESSKYWRFQTQMIVVFTLPLLICSCALKGTQHYYWDRQAAEDASKRWQHEGGSIVMNQEQPQTTTLQKRACSHLASIHTFSCYEFNPSKNQRQGTFEAHDPIKIDANPNVFIYFW